MTEEERKVVKGPSRLGSKFWKTFLLVLAAFLLFVGPTYVIYVLANVVDLNLFVSYTFGVALFAVGLFLVWYLIRNKIIS